MYPDLPNPLLLQVLRNLLQELETGDYRDPLGHSVMMNDVVLEAKELIDAYMEG